MAVIQCYGMVRCPKRTPNGLTGIHLIRDKISPSVENNFFELCGHHRAYYCSILSSEKEINERILSLPFIHTLQVQYPCDYNPTLKLKKITNKSDDQSHVREVEFRLKLSL